MPLTAVPLSPVFGARVTGFDTGSPASAEEAAALRRLLVEHKLLVVPGGRLSAARRVIDLSLRGGLQRLRFLSSAVVHVACLSGLRFEPLNGWLGRPQRVCRSCLRQIGVGAAQHMS